MECFKRGDFVVLAELENMGGLREKAISAAPNGTSDAAEIVAFFTSENCDVDTVIDNAWLAADYYGSPSCSSYLPNDPHDYSSWSVWDMCGGEADCSLE